MNRSSDVDMFISRLSRTCHAPFVLAVIDSYASDPRSAIRGQRMATTESPPVEMDILKAKLAKVEAQKTQGAIVRSRTRWYEYGEKNSKYFYSLEKTNYRRKHVASIKTQEDKKITDPKRFFRQRKIFLSKYIPQSIWTHNFQNLVTFLKVLRKGYQKKKLRPARVK